VAHTPAADSWNSSLRYQLPALLLAAGVVFNLTTPPHATFMPLFAAAPLIAAALLGLRATAAYGILAIGLVAVISLAWREDRSVATEVYNVITVGTIALLALGINLLVARGVRRAANAHAIALAVQRAMVPDPPPRVGEVRVATRYRAAHREALIGGDLYAALTTPFGVRMILGDVRGKGLEATESVAVVLGAFREAAAYEPDLAVVGARLEAALGRAARENHLAGGPADESFVTAVLAEVPAIGLPGAPGTSDAPGALADEVRLLNCGHPPPLLLGTGGEVTALEPEEPALPLGLAYLGAAAPKARSIPLPPGATVLLYTDGVIEARDPRGEFYDPVRRLTAADFADPEQLLDWLLEDVARHGGAAADDIALMAVRRA
jgi:hypothetical protein